MKDKAIRDKTQESKNDRNYMPKLNLTIALFITSRKNSSCVHHNFEKLLHTQTLNVSQKQTTLLTCKYCSEIYWFAQTQTAV